jgi:hypothetical protein
MKHGLAMPIGGFAMALVIASAAASASEPVANVAQSFRVQGQTAAVPSGSEITDNTVRLGDRVGKRLGSRFGGPHESWRPPVSDPRDRFNGDPRNRFDRDPPDPLQKSTFDQQ